MNPVKIQKTFPVELLVLATILLIFTLHTYHFNFVCDDAFISFRYARNLVQHGQLVYNLNQKVEGFSNFLWTVMIAAGIRFGGDPVNFSKTMGWLFGFSTIILTYFFGKSLIKKDDGPIALTIAFVAPSLLAISSSFACWSSGGLETQAFTFFTTSAIFSFIREENSRRPAFRFSAILSAISCLIRYEGFAIALLLCLTRVIKAFISRKKITRKQVVNDLNSIICFLTIIAPYLIWKTNYYGEVLPNTYYLKSGGLEMARRGWDDFKYYLSMTRSFLLAAFLLFTLPIIISKRQKRETMILFLLLSAFWTGFYIWIGGDFMELARFLVPALPLVAIICQESIHFVVEYPSQLTIRKRSFVRSMAKFLPTVPFIALLITYTLFQIKASEYAMTDHSRNGTDSIGYLKKATHQWTIIGLWIKKDAGSSQKVIATSAAGAIGYYSELKLLDLLGLNDPYVPKTKFKFGNRPGHTKSANWDYISMWQPDYFLGHPEIDPFPKKLSEWEIEGMKSAGYIRRSVKINGLTPPYFSFWYKFKNKDE